MPKETFFNLPQEKRAAIYYSALKEFSAKGFEKSNVGEIAKAAQVSKGSMYQYFVDKDELFLYCVKTALDISFKATYSEEQSVNISIFDYIRGSLERGLNFLQGHFAEYLFLQIIFLDKQNRLYKQMMDYALEYSDNMLLKIIQANKDKGFIRNDIDDVSILLFIEGVSIQFKEYILRTVKINRDELNEKSLANVEPIMHSMINLLKNGLEG